MTANLIRRCRYCGGELFLEALAAAWLAREIAVRRAHKSEIVTPPPHRKAVLRPKLPMQFGRGRNT